VPRAASPRIKSPPKRPRVCDSMEMSSPNGVYVPGVFL
jgi:hypothetical protein